MSQDKHKENWLFTHLLNHVKNCHSLSSSCLGQPCGCSWHISDAPLHKLWSKQAAIMIITMTSVRVFWTSRSRLHLHFRHPNACSTITLPRLISALRCSSACVRAPLSRLGVNMNGKAWPMYALSPNNRYRPIFSCHTWKNVDDLSILASWTRPGGPAKKSINRPLSSTIPWRRIEKYDFRFM